MRIQGFFEQQKTASNELAKLKTICILLYVDYTVTEPFFIINLPTWRESVKMIIRIIK